MSSSMHVYGSLPAAGVLDRWPAPTVPAARTATRQPAAWPLPNIATRVDLAPPAVWGAPDPELLLSITIAPLRFAPVSWAPPVVVRSPWGPPAGAFGNLDPAGAAPEVGVSARRRVWAIGLAAAVVVGFAAAVTAIF